MLSCSVEALLSSTTVDARCLSRSLLPLYRLHPILLRHAGSAPTPNKAGERNFNSCCFDWIIVESPGQDMLLFTLYTHPTQHRLSLALTLATNWIVLEERSETFPPQCHCLFILSCTFITMRILQLNMTKKITVLLLSYCLISFIPSMTTMRHYCLWCRWQHGLFFFLMWGHKDRIILGSKR